MYSMTERLHGVLGTPAATETMAREDGDAAIWTTHARWMEVSENLLYGLLLAGTALLTGALLRMIS